MQNEVLVAVGAGLGGMLGWGFADFFAKKTIDEAGDIVSLVWAHVFGSAAFVAIALWQTIALKQPVVIPDDGQNWFLLAAFGALQALVYLLVYRGFGKGQIALLNPVFASFSGLTAMLSIVAFGESTTALRIFALAIIFTGILLISVDMQALRQRRIAIAHIPGLREIALATALAAIWTIFWGQFINGKDWLWAALFMYVFMTLAILAAAIVLRVRLSITKPHLWKLLVLIGVCEAVAYLAISLGYSQTSLTSVVALISGAFSLPTILLARGLLNERTTFVQTVGSFVIVGGIVLLPL